MYDAVLIPTDGSDGTSIALEHGIDLATRHDATVHALYVVNRKLYLAAPEDEREERRESLREEGDGAVASVADAARGAGLDVETAVEEGSPERVILDYAAGADVDAIAMGTHGRTGREKLVSMGGVTEAVVKGTTVPVLVVPIGRDEREGDARED